MIATDKKELFDKIFILFFLKHCYTDSETNLIYPEKIIDINSIDFSIDITRLLGLFLTYKYDNMLDFSGNRCFDKQDLLNLLKEEK